MELQKTEFTNVLSEHNSFICRGLYCSLTSWSMTPPALFFLLKIVLAFWGLFCSSLVAQMVNAGDLGSIPASGRSPGEGNGNPVQYSCLENTMDGGAW